MNRKISTKTKEEIINKYLSGENITTLSKSTGISRCTIYNWISKLSQTKPKTKTLNLRDYHNLKVKCERQELIIQILKTSPCTVKAPLKEKLSVIKDLSKKYNVNTLCEALEVAKGTYYNYLLRNKNEDTLSAKKRLELTPIIEKIYHDNYEIFGANKIHAILKERGYKVAQSTIANIMHENGWFAIGTSSKKLYMMYQERKQNILNQQFQVSKPNEVWVSDVTYFKYKHKTYYICVIIDLYARKVVGYHISLKNNTQLTKDTFKIAYNSRHPSLDLLFHSDQGSNYTSKSFINYLIKHGIKQSFSRASMPYDNSVIESFFKFLKSEKLYRTDFRYAKEFKTAVKEYMEFYNDKRPHSMIHYQTPNRYEAQYYSKSDSSQN